MLYLDSFENAEDSRTEDTEDSRTERKFAICSICSFMPNIMELVPSKELLAQWQSQEISWEEFRKQFFKEMRVEYSKGEESRLKGLTEYSLENDVTLYSPEPSGQQTYRAILEEIVNIIWKEEGRTARVVNRALESVEESQLTEIGQGQMETIPQEDEQRSELQEDFARFISEMSKTNENIKSLQEMITNKDEQIQSLQTENRNKDTKNDELERKIDRLEEKISNQKGDIQSLGDVIGERDRLNRKNRELEKQVNKHETTIGNLNQTLSEKEEIISNQKREIQSLQAENRKRGRANTELKTQIAQLQDINAHPGIKDIAVKATGNDPAFAEYFGTLDIDKNLPIELRRWLEKLLIPVVDPLGNMGFESLDLNTAINQYSDFERGDELLAHVIRTQGNLSAHPGIDERTRMGRALCCFFAAALLSPKLPELE